MFNKLMTTLLLLSWSVSIGTILWDASIGMTNLHPGTLCVGLGGSVFVIVVWLVKTIWTDKDLWS